MNPGLDEYLSSNDRLLVAKDIDHCLRLLVDIGDLGHPAYYFRGISDEKYRLLSSLDRMVMATRHFILGARHQKSFREQLMTREFKAVARNDLDASSIPSTNFEWLSLMQHNGIPTRLVDLTKSPFIALYFAVRHWTRPTDAAVWAIAPGALHEASRHRLKRSNFPHPIPGTNYGYSRMSEFVTDEYFAEAFLTGRYDVAMILNPEWANSRLARQQGAFLIAGSDRCELDETLVDLVCDTSHLDPLEAETLAANRLDMSIRKLIVPSSMKKDLLIQLRRMNIHAGTLFPGVEGAAMGVMEHGLVEEWDTYMEAFVGRAPRT